MLPFADIDVDFAKSQLLLFLSDRYQHPNGQVGCRIGCGGGDGAGGFLGFVIVGNCKQDVYKS